MGELRPFTRVGEESGGGRAAELRQDPTARGGGVVEAARPGRGGGVPTVLAGVGEEPAAREPRSSGKILPRAAAGRWAAAAGSGEQHEKKEWPKEEERGES